MLGWRLPEEVENGLKWENRHALSHIGNVILCVYGIDPEPILAVLADRALAMSEDERAAFFDRDPCDLALEGGVPAVLDSPERRRPWTQYQDARAVYEAMRGTAMAGFTPEAVAFVEQVVLTATEAFGADASLAEEMRQHFIERIAADADGIRDTVNWLWHDGTFNIALGWVHDGEHWEVPKDVQDAAWDRYMALHRTPAWCATQMRLDALHGKWDRVAAGSHLPEPLNRLFGDGAENILETLPYGAILRLESLLSSERKRRTALGLREKSADLNPPEVIVAGDIDAQEDN